MKSILPEQYEIEKQFSSRVNVFLSRHEIGKILHCSNFQKEKGVSCFDLFKFIFLLVFTGKNLYRNLQSKVGSERPEKDASNLVVVFP